MVDLVCHYCGTSFRRSYKISRTRAAKPQFCARSCQVADQKMRASERLQERFWERVKRGDDGSCWLWLGRRNETGYGLFDHNNRPHIASRFAYELTFGPLPAGLAACHECDNPQCVNPKHLFAGTQKDNMEDASRKGRVPGGNGLRGSLINKSKLSEQQARHILSSLDSASELAAKYGVSRAAIYKIRNRENWGWLDA
ncbi:HNH endonuclease [Sinorhizobium meliloti]|uniref:HNH endonuclease n=1 Tax=Rhizobium meliloti TaxID=382 RepID=UPI000FDC40B3|nr:HNH endonuclease [Sinorhizobium meliloti]RVH21474.1 hypothetical protein CN216_00440 [Sinorhizobium meliloti]RVH21535.1 hypothetical protein CN216_00760 [Sinorhizobium meliloti]